jgi:hypothetical protein
MPLVLARVGGCRGSASGCGGGPGRGARRLTTPAPDASACLPPSVGPPLRGPQAYQAGPSPCPTPLPGGADVPRHRELACPGPGARGKRLRQTLHPPPRGELSRAADLRHRRATAPQAPLEPHRTFNSTWLIKRHAFRPPDAVRQDQLSTAALAALAATRCLSSRRRYTSLPPTSTVRLRQQVSAEGLGLAVGPVGRELEGAGAGAKRP